MLTQVQLEGAQQQLQQLKAQAAADKESGAAALQTAARCDQVLVDKQLFCSQGCQVVGMAC